ncbi:MAG: hypothetical protein A2667_01845 [Candidatus Wildermuthbacteria bacterium RIFCSPHIGHO2_01_FULL_47_27]|uniref:Type IV pilus modification protein PilV n=2 Tax=Candidatus Wildermuthiibacteriota TaxID=1817923 RepID=A0A1G2RRR2_9BACT|nr:MAG: hypothetical protein A2667_01845 [Candidatus Wildermuthbacteria bacterium RIFCSPHIGHO2_01_FULL_47_27]OHA68930.1 MAG: hypothetical protein A3D59_00535 [Candidatus Wildermuthbacteria bacterium RIFCSPHIGHO2_02_FULL_47_17]OHA75290.1 MAG: hypothetical protein A3I38_02830 [Candidatus Wildermuthbacteria bacterium RIFCSPLOWO2_02_FULL_47_10]OHA75533.1 MAG: hypothetical protein A3A32_00595 [Candidatus Wildermuthbacteria bacterium RIFCSPLOWO2_01_FULL_48_35]
MRGFVFSQFSHESGAGFTIIEVIVAIFLLTVGAVGVYSLVNQALMSASILSSRLTAVYLAQEGVEIGRNIRDGNWLEMADGLQCGGTNVEWADGLPFSPPKDRRGQYDTAVSDPCDGLPAHQDPPTPLIINSEGFYADTGSGITTPFTRVIHIEKPESGPNTWREITVIVRWRERGRTHNTIAQEKIYNWR